LFYFVSIVNKVSLLTAGLSSFNISERAEFVIRSDKMNISLCGTTILGKYKVLEIIPSASGQARVYKAYYVSGRENVIIKVPLIDSSIETNLLKRLIQEAALLKRLRHEFIVRILDVGEHDGQPVIVMEYIDSTDLRTWLDQHGNKLALKDALAVVKQIGIALDFAHRNGIIHCDIKPQNILVQTINSSRTSVKLADFGLARFLTDSLSTKPSIVGTLGYIAPETFSGELPSRQSDIFSLACVFYEMTVGQALIDINENPSNVNINSRLGNIRWVAIRSVLARALNTDPKKRYVTTKEFVDKLEAASPQKNSIFGISRSQEEIIFKEVDEISHIPSVNYVQILESIFVAVATGVLAYLFPDFNFTFWTILLAGLSALAASLLLTHKRFLQFGIYVATTLIASVSIFVSLLLQLQPKTSVADTSNITPPQPTVTISDTSLPGETTNSDEIQLSRFVSSTVVPKPTATFPELVDFGTQPPASEFFMFNAGLIEEGSCQNCIKFEITLIDENFRPLEGAVLYFDYVDSGISFSGTTQTDANGRVERVFTTSRDRDFMLYFVRLDNSRPNRRDIPGDGAVISASHGSTVHASVRLTKHL
jgi:serine/threonine protein kinase